MDDDLTTAYIDKDEWYPVYSVRLPQGGRVPYGDPIVVPRQAAERWKRAADEFDRAQREMAEAWEAQ